MGFPSPTERQLRAAFSDHRVPFVEHRKANAGRGPWPSGLRAATVHHTAGKNSADYLASFNYGGCNAVINSGRYNGRENDGRAVIICWGSAWHSGAGGPWRGVAARDSLHLVSWGIEVESLGTRRDITDEQVETTGRMLAALADLGMPVGNVHRHADWTDGTGPVGGHPLPTDGRKIDTRADLGYTTAFWQKQADLWRLGEWDGVTPTVTNIAHGDPKATWRLQARLYDLGYRARPPVTPAAGPRLPVKALRAFQDLNGLPTTGAMDRRTQERLFGMVAL